MATQNNFVIEYGLTVGSSEVINSSGKVIASALSAIDADDISEGSTNLYFTDSRFNTSFAAKDTDDLSEGSTNLYFTNARARGAISVASGGDLAYNSTSGELSLSTVDGGTF